jgi:predicted dehydrogenase
VGQEAEHDGGFQLEAGCHFVAALRAVMGDDVVEARGAATHTTGPCLPPPDTMAGGVRWGGVVGGAVMVVIGVVMMIVPSCGGASIWVVVVRVQ